MSHAASPKISRGPHFPVVWLVPVVALAIGGWMMFRELRNRGTEITIHFPDGTGVEAGKTALMHKGVSVGSVRSVEIDRDLRSVVVKLQLNRNAAAFANAGSEFWIVRPEVTFSGVRGLETLIAGVHLDGQPGGGPPAKEFYGQLRQPAPEDKALGRAFILRGDKLGSLSTGAPVYYRESKVGEVETSRLADDSTAVVIRVRIYTAYADLVRTNTVFWNAGGAAFKVNLLGAELKSTSIESLFSGGISLATPENDKEGLAPVAADGTQFSLHDTFEKEWLKWQPHIPIKPLDTEPAHGSHVAEVPEMLKTESEK